MEYPPGWTCEVARSRLELYVRRAVTRVDALAIAEHLEACLPCAQRLALLAPPAGGSPTGDAAANG